VRLPFPTIGDAHNSGASRISLEREARVIGGASPFSKMCVVPS
jgi:hypothetical protein